MVRIVKQDVIKYDPIEENYYVGTLTGIKEVQSKFKDPKTDKYNMSLRFSFTIEGYDNVVASILLSNNLRPGTKLDLALRACGYNTDVGDGFDTEEIAAMGLKARVFIESNPNADGNVFYNVTKIKPIGSPSVPAAETVTPPAGPVAQAPAKVTITPKPAGAPAAAPAVQAPAPAPVVVADTEEIDFNA